VGLKTDIGEGPVGLDTAVFVYWIEAHPRYAPVVEPLFEAIDAGRLVAVTSGLSLLEVLVVPLRAGDLDLAARYEALLTRSRGLRLMEMDRRQLRLAAQLRATFGRLRTPDALQLAAALGSRCSSFVTNDRRLPSIPGLPVVQLRDYLASRA
jgi:predicted nucleic acid-binding protein